MGTMRFNERDAELLYSFPKPASDVAIIVRNYTFINRAAPPTYGELASCLIKALRAGIIRKEGEGFVVAKDWYDRIHKADAAVENEIESLLAFEETFVKIEFEETTNAASVLSEEEYRWILTTLR